MTRIGLLFSIIFNQSMVFFDIQNGGNGSKWRPHLPIQVGMTFGAHKEAGRHTLLETPFCIMNHDWLVGPEPVGLRPGPKKVTFMDGKKARIGGFFLTAWH